MRTRHPHDFVFYTPGLEHNARTVDIVGEEHHHLSRVLRMSSGETVHVSDGRGIIARCRIEEVTPGNTRLRVEEVVDDRTSESPLVLALALLKKDAYAQAVEQCTELGVTRFMPFVAATTHVKDYAQAYLERLRRIALSAMKQSFRAILPVVDEPVSFDTLIERARDFACVVVGDAGAPRPVARVRPRPLLIVVGPEGGLSDEERDRLVEAGGERVAVSDHRLRSATAAVVLTGLFAERRGAGSD